MPHNYPPVDRCIYCGKEGSDLTDEHIVPYSLGGDLVLPKSSCKKCAGITHKYERTCARSIFGNFRMKYKLPTRRRKDRLSHLPYEIITDDGQTKALNLPVAEHPAPTLIYKIGKANILYGLAPDSGIFQCEQAVVANYTEMDELLKKHGAKKSQHKIYSNPLDFARMLAKIGYGYAVAELGINGFRPFGLDIVLCRSNDVFYTVGSTFDLQPSVYNGGHRFNLYCQTLANRPPLVIVDIHLFSSLPMPIYHVVVGELAETKQFLDFINRSEPPIQAPS